jgi:heat shock protein HslJ
MSRFEQLLDQAAGTRTEPTFESADIERRAGQRRVRRRIVQGVTGSFAALAIVIAVSAVAVRSNEDEGEIVAEPGTSDTLAADELTEGRWILTAVSEVTTFGGRTPWIEFRDDGTFGGDGGCNGFFGEWSLDGNRLETSDVGSTLIGCSDPTGEIEARLIDRLGSDPTLSRFDDEPHTLQLTTSDGFDAFTQLDSIGPPSDENLTGGWRTADGRTIRFQSDGVVSVEACGDVGLWARDRELVFEPTGGLGCLQGELSELRGEPSEIQGSGSYLYVSGDTYVITLRSDERA